MKIWSSQKKKKKLGTNIAVRLRSERRYKRRYGVGDLLKGKIGNDKRTLKGVTWAITIVPLTKVGLPEKLRAKNGDDKRRRFDDRGAAGISTGGDYNCRSDWCVAIYWWRVWWPQNERRSRPFGWRRDAPQLQKALRFSQRPSSSSEVQFRGLVSLPLPLSNSYMCFCCSNFSSCDFLGFLNPCILLSMQTWRITEHNESRRGEKNNTVQVACIQRPLHVTNYSLTNILISY